MDLTEFRSAVRLFVPAAKITKIGNTVLDRLINRAVDDVNIYSLAYKGDKKFNVVAEVQDYKWSDEIADFACIDDSGIWWNTGTADDPNWKKLEPLTRSSLDDLWPNWRDESSGDPNSYVIEGDNLLIHYKPDTGLSEGFWASYIKVAVAMTSGGNYPFTGTSTELTVLRVLDDAIIDYVRWKLARPLGSDQKGVISERDYRINLSEKTKLLNRRRDQTASPNNRMRGPTIG